MDINVFMQEFFKHIEKMYAYKGPNTDPLPQHENTEKIIKISPLNWTPQSKESFMTLSLIKHGKRSYSLQIGSQLTLESGWHKRGEIFEEHIQIESFLTPVMDLQAGLGTANLANAYISLYEKVNK